MAMVLGLSGAQADTFIAHRSAAESALFQDYLEATFTAASLGTISNGRYRDAPPAAVAGDLVIIFRHSSSGDYDDNDVEKDAWNGLEANMLNMNVYTTRPAVWGWFDGATTGPGNTDQPGLGDDSTALLPTDSLFNGVGLSGTLADVYTDFTASPTNPHSGLATTDATAGGEWLLQGSPGAPRDGQPLLVRFAKDSAINSPSAGATVTTHQSDRIYFNMPDSASGGFDELTADGLQILGNSLVELGLVLSPADPVITNVFFDGDDLKITFSPGGTGYILSSSDDLSAAFAEETNASFDGTNTFTVPAAFLNPGRDFFRVEKP